MVETPADTTEQDDRLTRDFRVGLPARDAAVSLLDTVLGRGQSFDAVFGAQTRHGRLATLAQRDKALTRAIAATTLRRLGQIDALLAQFIARPPAKSSGPLGAILRTALAQILFMGTPSHAVVNLAVHQAKSDRRARHFDKLVNAVLRRATREGAELVAQQDAVRLNTPDWLWQRWCSHFGEETTRAIALAHLSEAALDLSVKSDASMWAENLDGLLLPTGSVRLAHKGRIESLAGYDDGAWWVQDAAAALPALLLGEMAGKSVVDLCAAPGGKTAQLASRGARVTALDISENRLEWLKGNLERLQLEVRCVVADATTWRPGERFDAVLLDAPCLATGTIRRHPDIPHLKKPADLDKLAALQARLLDAALTLIEPGGTLVYCTCSLEPEECEAQIDRLLATSSNLRLDPISPDEIAGQADWLSDRGMLRTLPHQLSGLGPGLDGIDGFFAARLRLG
jgi:16S rRNA (cytosine967-C5)-methyltransferase